MENMFHSLYFFYWPQYKQLSLGINSALIELEYLKYLNKYFPEFKFYNMGYFVNESKKV